VSSSGHHAGHYQAVLKEMWENMDESERERYDEAAKDHSNNISKYVNLEVSQQLHLMPTFRN
jgi:hypothetical protein